MYAFLIRESSSFTFEGSAGYISDQCVQSIGRVFILVSLSSKSNSHSVGDVSANKNQI